MFWLEGDRLDIPKGEKLTLRYRVIVHSGDSGQAGIATSFEAYRKTAK
jgi:hypothetical protein